jgi:hypothetical protein
MFTVQLTSVPQAPVNFLFLLVCVLAMERVIACNFVLQAATSAQLDRVAGTSTAKLRQLAEERHSARCIPFAGGLLRNSDLSAITALQCLGQQPLLQLLQPSREITLWLSPQSRNGQIFSVCTVLS